MANSAKEALIELPDDAYQVEEIDLASWDPATQTAFVVFTVKNGEREKRRLPVYLLPRLARIKDLHDFNTAQRPFWIGHGVGLTIGDRAAAETRHKNAQTQAGWPPTRKRPSGRQVHIFPHKVAQESALIKNGVFGGAGPVPKSQNGDEGRYFGGFLTATGIQGKQG